MGTLSPPWLVLPLLCRDAVAEESIDLLDTPSSNFTNAEVHICPCDKTQAGVDKAGLRTKVGRVV